VGRRKIETLLAAGAKVKVMDPYLDLETKTSLVKTKGVQLHLKTAADSDLDGVSLAFAASSDHQANLDLIRICRKRGIPCNSADAPGTGSFILPAVHAQGELILAVSTGGASPALARQARKRLAKVFGKEYAVLCNMLKLLRPLVLELDLPQAKDQEIFRSLTEDEVLEAISERDWPKCQRCLQSRLPRALHQYIGDLYVPFKDL
jgi:precorrin-2 dehydrogenase/sirohydrochlorin ferrochelatase